MSWCSGCTRRVRVTRFRFFLSLSLVAFCAIALVEGCRAPLHAAYPGASREPFAAPVTQLTPAQARAVWEKAQGVLENRCVVCHGCYDAPCQLKLGSFEGIDRGGSETKVYDASRLTEIAPTRLFVDAHGPAEWRKLGFHPVLPGDGSDPRASVLTRMLDLKREHPLLESTDIAKDFTLDLDRKQTCADGEHFERYASDHPLWGMPYALPGLDDRERASV